jgi:hypothetical protein
VCRALVAELLGEFDGVVPGRFHGCRLKRW